MISRGMALITSADAAVLVWLRPDLAALTTHLRAPHRWLAVAGADGAAAQLATAGLWVLAVWVGVGLLAVAGRALPGGLGRFGDRLARLVLPRICYRAVAGAIGIGALAAPVSAAATPGAAHPTAAGRPIAMHRLAVTPTWPTDPRLPTPSWPTTPAPTTPASSKPAKPSPTTPAAAVTTSTVEPSVVVRPGDSLWLIAAARLGPSATEAEIAAAWPRWYAANQAQIGADPNQLPVGVTLHGPGPSVQP
jgi:resuscitation-promoting factor RpfA